MESNVGAAFCRSHLIEELTIPRLHELLRRGEVTCEALVRAYLARIADLDAQGPCLNAVIAVNPHAVDEARALDEELRRGGPTWPSAPLYGVPVLLKDNCETADMPTTAGSRSLEDFRTGRDADLVRRLREAGAVILAKTNLHEFAIWGETVSSMKGQTLNPYDLTRTPGGSSGGTGAAVAANFGLVGIGTDTVNSIRSPASACALCGIRPTVGLVSSEGIVPYANTQDTAGPIARTVEDAVRVLDVIAMNNGHRPASYLNSLNADGLRGKRIGLLESFWGSEAINAPVNNVVQAALARLREAGAVLVPIADAIDPDWLVREVSVHLYELKEHLGAYLTAFGERAPVHSIDEILASGKYTPDIEENLKTANGLGTDMLAYAERLERRAEVQRQVLAILERERLDALLYPHQQQLVSKVGAGQKQRNGVLGSVTGFPAIVVPGGFADGVPVGLEFLGRPFDEPQLIEIVYGLEQAEPIRVPPVL